MTSPTASAPPPLRDTLVSGSIWMIALKWVLRLLGAINIAILARLLTPEDFGVVAMATVIVGLSKVFFELGVDYALIRDPNASVDDFHSAWTIRLLQSIALAGCLCLVAPFAENYYQDDRVAVILYILAVGIVVQGLTNIGIVSFRKELQFGREFKFLVSSKLLSTASAIALAFYFRSYWALVLGTVFANVIECSLSYVFHSFRPRLELTTWRKIWSFSKWILVLQVSNYFMAKFDRLLLGNAVPADQLGHYTVGIEISQMATTEVVAPVSRALVPGFAKLQVDEERLRKAYLQTLGATAILVMPLSLGLSMVAKDLVPLALGPQWFAAIPIVQLASIHLMFATLGSAASNISLVTGHIRKLAALSIIRAILFLSLFYPIFTAFEIPGVLMMKIAIGFCMTTALIAVVASTHSIRWSLIAKQLWRPGVASMTMVFSLSQLEPFIDSSPILALAINTFVGGVVYIMTLASLSFLFGGRQNLEFEIGSLIWRKLRRR